MSSSPKANTGYSLYALQGGQFVLQTELVKEQELLVVCRPHKLLIRQTVDVSRNLYQPHSEVHQGRRTISRDQDLEVGNLQTMEVSEGRDQGPYVNEIQKMQGAVQNRATVPLEE